jgi:hypothetical protein
MNHPGPSIEHLVRRLVETPSDFLDEPNIGKSGQVFVAALVNDLLYRHDRRASVSALARFRSANASADRNRLALTMIAVWLLMDDWFLSIKQSSEVLLRLLDTTVTELAVSTPAHQFVTDPDRREELARIFLARLGYRPEGETIAQATDRLSGISGTERRRLLEATRESEKRARAIREALAKKAAEESADKWTRE